MNYSTYQRVTRLLVVFLMILSTSALSAVKVTGVVSDESGTLPGAIVALKSDATKGTTTDMNGRFTIDVDLPAVLVASFVGYDSMELLVTEANKNSANFSLSAGILKDEVIIVGSRSKPRTALESAVPIDAIGISEIENSAQPNVTQILQFAAPSFHSTPQTISDGTDHVDPASLRGLGPDQTLVLVNGKRRHSSALLNVNGTVGRGTVGTDLNTIPTMAIKRIEILRDGAAAQYGSDAIAGVINIVLQDQTEKVGISFETGGNLPNLLDGPSNAAGDVPDELIPEFLNDGQTYKLGSNFGFRLGDLGFVNVTGEYLERESSNRSGNYTGNPYPTNYINGTSEEAFYQHVRDEYGFADKQVMQIGNSDLRNMSAVLNSAYHLSDHAELYASFTFNYRDGLARGFYRFPSSQGSVVPSLYPQGFSPAIKSDIMDDAFTVGLRGKVGEWDTDFSQTRGSNQFDFTIENSVNASLGSGSPTSAYAGGFSYGQNSTNMDFSRGYDAGFPINVAFGGEFRLENYEIFQGEEASYINGGQSNAWITNDGTGNDTSFVAGSAGIQVFPGFQPQNALNKSRNNVALYGDFELDFTEEWLVSLAGRLENYSDFGKQFTWKFATRYRFTDDFTLRGSASTGFRAPSLHQVHFNNLSTQFIDVNGEQTPVQVGTFNNSSSITRAFGIDELEPETSLNLSLGVTTRLTDNWTLTVDAYQIAIEDRIVISGRFSPGTILADGSDAGDILIPLGAGAAQFFTNAVSTTTQGVDLISTYRMDVGTEGSLKLSLAGNFTKTEVDKDANGNAEINASPLLEGLEEILYNREEVSRIEVAQPQSKFVLSAEYARGDFSALLRATHFGEITYIHPNDGDPADWTMNDFTGEIETRDQVFAPKIVPDVEFGYRVDTGVKLTLGMHNFLNVYPDMHQHSGNASSGRFLFSRRVQQFGVRGAYAYFKLGLSF